jgi:hypothetical protein
LLFVTREPSNVAMKRLLINERFRHLPLILLV